MSLSILSEHSMTRVQTLWGWKEGLVQNLLDVCINLVETVIPEKLWVLTG